MIKSLINKKTKRTEEEEKKGDKSEKKKKTTPAEIRWRKEIPELDLPDHAETNFPDDKDIMNFEVYIDLSNEDCLWQGGKYKFTINVPKQYPHKPPKVK
jgi:ubiquitin-protein ligase